LLCPRLFSSVDRLLIFSLCSPSFVPPGMLGTAYLAAAARHSVIPLTALYFVGCSGVGVGRVSNCYFFGGICEGICQVGVQFGGMSIHAWS